MIPTPQTVIFHITSTIMALGYLGLVIFLILYISYLIIKR